MIGFLLRRYSRGAQIERMNAHNLDLMQVDGQDVWVHERGVTMEGPLSENIETLIKVARMQAGAR